ncbi:unnamed protein product, partial [Symbiodinium natans]
DTRIASLPAERAFLQQPWANVTSRRRTWQPLRPASLSSLTSADVPDAPSFPELRLGSPQGCLRTSILCSDVQ